jgi:hypothetical protein
MGICPSPNPEKISIIIETDPDCYNIVNWDVPRNFEYSHHEIEGDFFITFDDHEGGTPDAEGNKKR